jgi:hypothetical protein
MTAGARGDEEQAGDVVGGQDLVVVEQLQDLTVATGDVWVDGQ